MANVLNLPEILTFEVVKRIFVYAPGQVYLRGGPTAQPIFGLRRARPQNGQIWPRSEFNRERFKP